MNYFPQLSSGALGQLPLRWTDAFRSIANVLPDGTTILNQDAGATGISWDLTLAGLNDEERSSLEAFFESAQGVLNPFTMLDPADNLLAFSQDFTQACWSKDPLLTIATGIADPLGATNATTIVNAAQTTQNIYQVVSGPGAYRYCFSAYICSSAAATLSLTLSSGGVILQQAVQTSPKWQRYTLSGSTGIGDGVVFGIALPSGAQIQLFGAQAEAQPGSSLYKATGLHSGSYEDCRFDQNELQMTATGPGQYSCALRIRSAGSVSWQA